MAATTTTTSNKDGSVIDVKRMREILDLHHLELRDRVFKFFKDDPLFDLCQDHGLSLKEKRALTYQRCIHLARSGLVDVTKLTDDAWESQAVLESLAYHDASLQVRFGVHSGLFAGSILRMGTEKHRQKYADAINKFTVQGAFAMTELGHGSNVQQLQTVATFDKASDSFILNTPSDLAQKFWIGGIAEYGNTAVVFAQLYIDGKHYGVHPFIVPLRDEHGKTLPGIVTADVGPKQGVDGIDNGRLWLENVKVPRENLLNRFNDVDKDGNYSSPFAKQGDRFLANMGALLGARANVGICSNNVSKIGVTIAIKYGLSRRQFGGGNGEEETRLMDYSSHQVRLLPLLATTYALCFFSNEVKSYIITHIRDVNEQKMSHEYAACIKVYSSKFMNELLQICRECCGGQGFSAYNRIGILRADWDMHVTVDGANYVLYQQVAKGCLDKNSNDLMSNRDMMVERANSLKKEVLANVNPACPNFWRKLFQFRYESKLLQLAQSLATRVEKGVNPKDAWDQSMACVWGVSDSYTEKLILESFISGLSKVEKGAIHDVLTLLLRLFALYCWNRDAGWFANYSGISIEDQEKINDQTVDVCAEIRPHALALVDGFGIPDHLVLAPIAGDWVSFYAKPKPKL